MGATRARRLINRWRPPNQILLAVITVLSAAWLAANLYIAAAYDTYAFSPRSLLSMALWMFCLAVLWAGIFWGAVAGLTAATISLLLGLGAIEQAIFLVLMAGICAAHLGPFLRRGFFALASLWFAWYASLLNETYTAALLFSVALLLMATSYAIGSTMRRMLERQERTRQALESAEHRHREALAQERRVLARDLHDIVAHDVTVIAMQAEAAQLSNDPHKRDQTLEVIRNSSRSALQDLRRIVEVLKEEGFVGAERTPSHILEVEEGIKKFADDLRSLGIPTETSMTGDWKTVSRSVHGAVYRILQECTTNIAKYGARSQGSAETLCRMDLEATDHHVHLHVTNRLPAALTEHENSPLSSKAGLKSIEDRARTFGGEVIAGPDHLRNWTTRVLNLSKS